MKSTKIMIAFVSAVMMAVFAATAFAAPLPAGTQLLLDQGVGSATNTPCSAGSCFSMEVSPGFVVWTDYGPGTDGGIIVGKSQLSGGQEVAPGAVGTDGELSNAWSFFSNNGTFYTDPNGDTHNIYDDAPCAGAACIGTTVLGVFNVAWNGNIIPMGSDAGCTLSSCSADQLAGIFVNDWQIDTVNQTWSMNYSQVVPSGGFQNVKFSTIMKGTVIVADLCAGMVCDDSNACTTDTCDPATGNCVFTPIDCNDNSACTTDTCDPAAGCVFTPIVCNDSNACTTDTCDAATGCVFTPIVCNDSNACTTDTCDAATGCVFTPVTCPTGQTCDPATGACVPSNLCTGIVCDDSNACTTDTCDPATGNCVFTPIDCNDNSACTTDTCDPAAGCVFTPIVCNDSNACTTDTCDAATGCVFTPVTCPTGQTCDPATGACVPSNLCTGIVCDDSSACTTDLCDPATGNCVFTPIVCNDSNACTTDTCDAATGCVFTPVTCPTGQTCDPATGACATVTGSDVGIVMFRAPSDVKDCRKHVPIQILTRNFGNTQVTGTITLYKDGEAVKTWDVVFYPMSNVNEIYHYDPAGDAGKTINWQAVVTIPDDPNLSNNSSSIESTVVSACKD